jgi:hypothetical protein
MNKLSTALIALASACGQHAKPDHAAFGTVTAGAQSALRAWCADLKAMTVKSSTVLSCAAAKHSSGAHASVSIDGASGHLETLIAQDDNASLASLLDQVLVPALSDQQRAGLEELKTFVREPSNAHPGASKTWVHGGPFFKVDFVPAESAFFRVTAHGQDGHAGHAITSDGKSAFAGWCAARHWSLHSDEASTTIVGSGSNRTLMTCEHTDAGTLCGDSNPDEIRIACTSDERGELPRGALVLSRANANLISLEMDATASELGAVATVLGPALVDFNTSAEAVGSFASSKDTSLDAAGEGGVLEISRREGVGTTWSFAAGVDDKR